MRLKTLLIISRSYYTYGVLVQMEKTGVDGPMTNRVKVWTTFQDLIIETNNFTFGIKEKLGQASTFPAGQLAKIRFYGPHDQ